MELTDDVHALVMSLGRWSVDALVQQIEKMSQVLLGINLRQCNARASAIMINVNALL